MTTEYADRCEHAWVLVGIDIYRCSKCKKRVDMCEDVDVEL